MSSATDYLARRDNFLRLFIYGYGKTKKTWWACAAAEAGFNVLLLDTDRGAAIIRNLSPAALERIHVIPCADRGIDPVAFQFIQEFARSLDCYYHEGRSATARKAMNGSTRYDFKTSAPDTVLILDSWSALCRSIIQQFSNTHKINPTDAGKIDWDGYRWSGMMATWVLEMLKSIPCHLIIIGHQTTYEIWRQLPGKKRELIKSREQPISISYPHGSTLSTHFDEMYRFTKQGNFVYINTGGSENIDGGSRIVAPQTLRWEELPFAQLCKMHGIEPPGMESPVREYPVIGTSEKRMQAPVIPGNATSVPGVSLKSLLSQ